VSEWLDVISREKGVSCFKTMEFTMAPTSISKLKEARSRISKEMVVQLVCGGVMMLFVAIWVFSMYGSPNSMSRAEIEERMDEFARKYLETHDKEIARELSRLARELEKVQKMLAD
jgi:hypothetical protein